MNKNWLAHIRTLILVVLVGLSLLLSYWLWVGDFQNATEVGIGEPLPLAATEYPIASQLGRPYRIILSQHSAASLSVALPETHSYNQWLTLLQSVRVTALQEIPAFPKRTLDEVEYDFGVPLSAALLQQWVPNIEPTGYVQYSGLILLYQTSSNGPVWLGLTSGGVDYEAQTNLSTVSLYNQITEAVRAQPWSIWTTVQSNNDLPSSYTQLSTSTWTTNAISLLPVVHSFFVNPLVVTRIQEDNNTTLWTDGSRAVQWTKHPDEITYQDPNANGKRIENLDTLELAARFVRDHGGGPNNLIATHVQSNASGETITLVPYVDGLPILNGSNDYQVVIRAGRVVSFSRPLYNLASEIDSTRGNALNGWQLLNVLKTILSVQQIKQIQQIQLGLDEQDEGSIVSLIPAYFVQLPKGQQLIIDAIDGHVLGGDLP
ncbi:hypothetical protein FY534_13475 [Alicyclobacillus sp. TC]|uniref:two-component system activity regulator YycH n=1 Tax=Alicyclobacillus sp. TC TaxID=2606450 RepID=UPI001931A0AC|nr:two-component system activity regulator YycH [Alicyclobacillus sp. TC]QRF24519.1 hypothetical protein FY534_13475 [Alicyclobacillus sp. TC]